MIATILRLPEEEHAFYKDYAYKNGMSLNEFLSMAAKTVSGLVPKKKKYSIFDLGTKVVFDSGPKDGSINHDKYYYEFEESKRQSK